ncbi:MAG TPA: MotA/TolQ/ExbB proton channel family protein, partial [Chromatiaceae bacterium]|nr:MotA/TolQ/ExbB proton channel family protein [Chromatiaceae bacterium]
KERIEQGKEVGYLIIGLAIFGFLMAVYRFVALGVTSMKVRAQLKRADQPKKNNPLGRVLLAWKENQEADLDTLERKIDEAVVKEVPRLQRGLSIIKILAVIAPLLGLLGTVTGMIQTFQSITLFGTGDPKLMAGGISQALITTVLGLMAAIPLTFLHALVASSSRSLVQVLEEQSAGIIARQAEGFQKRSREC